MLRWRMAPGRLSALDLQMNTRHLGTKMEFLVLDTPRSQGLWAPCAVCPAAHAICQAKSRDWQRGLSGTLC